MHQKFLTNRLADNDRKHQKGTGLGGRSHRFSTNLSSRPKYILYLAWSLAQKPRLLPTLPFLVLFSYLYYTLVIVTCQGKIQLTFLTAVAPICRGVTSEDTGSDWIRTNIQIDEVWQHSPPLLYMSFASGHHSLTSHDTLKVDSLQRVAYRLLCRLSYASCILTCFFYYTLPFNVVNAITTQFL